MQNTFVIDKNSNSCCKYFITGKQSTQIFHKERLSVIDKMTVHHNTTAPASHLAVGMAASSYQQLSIGSKHSMLLMVSLQLNMSSRTKNCRPPITYRSPFTLTEHGAVLFWFISGIVSQMFCQWNWHHVQLSLQFKT